MNRVEQAVSAWLLERGIEHTKTEYGFSTPNFNIKCVPNDQSFPFYKEKNDRIVHECLLESHIKRLDEWLTKKPTIKIEKLDINPVMLDDKIIVTAKHGDELVAESEFWKEDTSMFWADTRYHNYHVPGWLSKSLSVMLKLDLGLPIETMTNSVDSAYERMGFKVIEQVDVRYYFTKMKINKKIPYIYPENIVMWRLRHDSISTV